MKRVAATIALAALTLVVVGRWQPGDPVHLLTGAPYPTSNGQYACFDDHANGPLVIDPKFGTAIMDTGLHTSTPVPVTWRPGFTGRRVGSDVEVFDPRGNVVATTGHRYMIVGRYDGGTFFACGLVAQT